MGKRLFSALVLALFLLSAPVAQAEENRDLVGTVLKAPFAWSQETLFFYRDLLGIPLGWDGDPQDNWNYAGNGTEYGFYESYSDESAYRYQRWGVN